MRSGCMSDTVVVDSIHKQIRLTAELCRPSLSARYALGLSHSIRPINSRQRSIKHYCDDDAVRDEHTQCARIGSLQLSAPNANRLYVVIDRFLYTVRIF